MAYIEVHATLRGSDIPTKRRLKELVTSGEDLWFDAVSPFNKFNGGLSEITEGTTLQVTLPNPWTNRRYFANIKRVNGEIKIS